MVKAIDCETTKAPNHFVWADNACLVSVSIYRQDGTSTAWILDHVEGPSDTHRNIISQIQKEVDTCSRLVAHNMKFDLQWLTHIGIDVHCPIYCTQIGEFTINSFEKGMPLKRLAKRYNAGVKTDRVSQYWEAGYETNEIPRQILLDYNVDDCVLAMRIFNKQARLLKEQGLVPLFNHTMEECRVLAELEVNGMLYDVALSLEIADDYRRRIGEIEERLEAIGRSNYSGFKSANGDYSGSTNETQRSDRHSKYKLDGAGDGLFNLGSKLYLSALLYGGSFPARGIELYDYRYKDGRTIRKQRYCQLRVKMKGLGIKPLRNSDIKPDGYSTAADVLKKLRLRTKLQKEVIALLGEHRKLVKQNNTYFDTLPEKLDENGYLHAKINQTIAQTARYSSSDPNGQNLPRTGTSPLRNCVRSRFNA